MATANTPEPVNPSVETTSIRELATELAGAIVAGQPKRKVSFAELKTDTPFNKSGKRTRKCARPTFINGLSTEQMMHTLHDEEYKLLDKLKPGRYINGRVTVEEIDLGPEQGKGIRVWYPARSLSDRMTNKGEWKDMRTMLKRCLDEAASVRSA